MVGNGIMNFTDAELNFVSNEFFSQHQLFGKELDDIWHSDC